MRPVTALPGHVDANNPTSEALEAALQEISREALESIHRPLAAAVVHYEETGDSGPLRHFAESLLITTRLYRNNAFKLALAEADASDARIPRGDPVDFQDFARARGVKRPPTA